jgi:hypothetical protein
MPEPIENVIDRKNRTHAGLVKLMKLIAEVRYISQEQLNRYNKERYIKQIGTKTWLAWLVKNEHLGLTENGGYYATLNSLEWLKAQGVNTEYMMKRPKRGEFEKHQQTLTDVILDYYFGPDYFATCYPSFVNPDNSPWFDPDALVIHRHESDKAEYIKLTFIEVENAKPDWHQHLLKKRENYEELAKSKRAFEWWERWSKKLKLEAGRIEDFCFSVKCHGDFNADWEGWE